MKNLLLTAAVAFAMTILLATAGAQDAPPKMPPMPAPEKEHAWLQQFVGEWESEAEMTPAPGQPAMKCKGTETVRAIGGFWILAENQMAVMDQRVTGILTLGYNPETKKYTGTWVDSMSSYMWKYEGAVDAAGKVLTLSTEGPCPGIPGKISKFREVLEIKDKDHKVFTSSILGDDGKWTTFVTVNSQRKK